MNIVLIGYMGSGKSTIATILKEHLNLKSVDLDTFIEQKEGMSIPELFEKRGEIYFRRIESKYLFEVLNDNESKVLALGGGTPCYGNNMSMIKQNENTTSFYLKTSISELAERIYSEKNKRPLISHLKSKIDLIEFIGKHLFERLPFYNQSTFTVNTSGKNTDQIIEEIIGSLI